ncbi:PEGA domain-containing protein [Luteitalea sp.]
MKSTHITSFLLAGLVFASAPSFLHADQRPRNPGGDSGGSSGGSGSSGGGTSTGSVAVPRGGGSSPWGGGGGVTRRPSEPTSSPSSGGRRPARVAGGSGGTGSLTVPPYSRARNGAPVTGYGVPRGSIATLPPIISGPVYWGPDNWYFYPWGFGGLGLGYFWDPWMWSGFMGGMGMGGWGGYPYDPYFGGGAGAGGFGAWGGGGGGGGGAYTYDDEGRPQAPAGAANPLDANGPTGGLRLKVEPRDAEVYVDGFYAGRVDDFDGAMQRLKIVQGAHRIELRAAGYETTTFDVNVLAGETTTYRTELKRR